MSQIYDKIQKLLNMANGTVQGAESEVALKMAHELMAANNITMSELDAVSREKELGELGRWNKGDKAYKTWEKTLATAMAKMFDCQVVYSSIPGSIKKSMNFIGREGNVKTSWLMYDWIHDKLWSDAKKKFVPYSASACNSYCIGAVNSIWERVREMKKQDEAKGDYGLVVVDEVKQYMKSLYPKLTKSSRHSTVTDSKAYGAGKQDGANIGLNKQFGLKAIC